MDLSEYLQLAKRSWKILIVLPVLFAAGGFANSSRETKLYSATATVLLRPNDPSERLGTANIGTATELINSARIVNSQANIADGPAVTTAAAKLLGGGVNGNQIRRMISVSSADDSNILLIKATTEAPDRAAEVANTVAQSYIDNRRESAVERLQRAIVEMDDSIDNLASRIATIGRQPESPERDAQLSSIQTQFKTVSERRGQLEIDQKLKRGEAEIVALAVPARLPISPHPVRSGIIGLVGGLLAAAGIALLRDRLDFRLRSRDDAEEITHLPTLAEIPVDRRMSKNSGYVAAVEHSGGVTAEAVRSLRVSMRFLSLERPMRAVLVTSAMPGDGKSTVAMNLAASYAISGARTLLVIADLRRPNLDSTHGASSGTGLVEILTELAETQESRLQKRSRGSRSSRTVVEPTEIEPAVVADIAGYCLNSQGNLWVLPAGQPVANPVEILGSSVAKDFFASARDQFDMVIVDSPPVLPVSDSLVISQLVDGVVFVVSLRQTNYKHVARGVERLQSVQARMLGLVLNRVPKDSDKAYYGRSIDRH